ncbi:MAG TPA: SDR family NAD(P)-dependent oxidoreductase [Candidatus Polarisedimenticolia bacterium]|nr:SDR family NAD(P)-dependent oxidoreductase [Candidatus Polarisedimenticolia bacterium]
MSSTLKDRVAIVTGGGGGIGRATAIALARAGAAVVVTGRTSATLEETLRAARQAAPEAPGAFALVLDVRREEDMGLMAARTLERFRRIDILVTCAGVLRAAQKGPRPTVDMAVEEWAGVIATNLRGTFLADRAVLPAMMGQRSGDIVNLSSTSGLRGYAYDAPYCASKFGILGLSEALAEEARAHGIRVQAVLPGPVATGIWEQNLPVPPSEKTLPVERVVDLIMYLLALPRDVVLANPAIVPLRAQRRPSWRAPGPGAAVGREGTEP